MHSRRNPPHLPHLPRQPRCLVLALLLLAPALVAAARASQQPARPPPPPPPTPGGTGIYFNASFGSDMVLQQAPAKACVFGQCMRTAGCVRGRAWA